MRQPFEDLDPALEGALFAVRQLGDAALQRMIGDRRTVETLASGPRSGAAATGGGCRIRMAVDQPGSNQRVDARLTGRTAFHPGCDLVERCRFSGSD
jgi:hypothetical protein